MNHQNPETASERRRLIGSTILGICWVAFPPLLGFWIIAEIGAIGDWLMTFGGPEIVIAGGSVPLYGLLIYAACFMVCCGLGILPTYAQAILGGWVFGFWLGTPAALIGFTGARRSVGQSVVWCQEIRSLVGSTENQDGPQFDMPFSPKASGRPSAS